MTFLDAIYPLANDAALDLWILLTACQLLRVRRCPPRDWIAGALIGCCSLSLARDVAHGRWWILAVVVLMVVLCPQAFRVLLFGPRPAAEREEATR